MSSVFYVREGMAEKVERDEKNKTQSCSMTRIHDCNPEDISSTVLHSNLENLILAELLVFELEFFRGNGNLSSSSRAMDGGEEEKDSPVSPRH